MTEFDDKTLARFWSKVNVGGSDDCWEWTASRHYSGYGKFATFPDGKVKFETASRVAYRIAYGAIPHKLVCHTCDNPPCCNPKHLFSGTHSDNTLDCVAKNRHKRPVFPIKPTGIPKLTRDDVAEIRKLINDGHSNIQIGRRFGVTHSNISMIRRNKTWSVSSAEERDPYKIDVRCSTHLPTSAH